MVLKNKKGATVWLVFAIIFLFFTFFSGWVIKFYLNYQGLPNEHLIGNRLSNVNKLKEEGFPFYFLVIGDTEGKSRGEILIKKALKDGRFSFLIHLGDMVQRPDIWEHRFFLTEMITEIRPPFPVFLVAGNHDIDYTSKIIKEKERRVTPEIFDSLYGARDFDFIYNQCLFILCDVDPKRPTDYLNYLRRVLSEKGSGKKYIFVFIHYPPKMVDKTLEGGLPKEDEFLSIMDEYKVTRCFFGHFHGYWRGERKGVGLIVAGGGGQLKKRQPEWGRFHHILKVRVNENMIDENLIVLEEGFGFEDSFEHWVFIKVFPYIQNQDWVLYFSTALFLFLGIFFFTFFIHKLRKAKGSI